MASLKHDLDRLYNNVRVDLPSVTDAAMRLASFEVLHEFFDESSIWLEDIAVTTVINQADYDLIPREKGEIIRLMQVLDGNNLAVNALMPTIGTLTLHSIPTSAEPLTATVAKTVGIPVDRDGAPELPDWVLPLFRIPVKHGIIGSLMMQKSKPWSDTQLAVYHIKRFRVGIAKARTVKREQNTFNATSWAFPQQFATRGPRRGFGGEFGR